MAFAAAGAGVSDRVFRRAAGEDPGRGGGSEQGGASGNRGDAVGSEGDPGDVDGGERGGEVLAAGDERVAGAGGSGCADRGGGWSEGVSGGDRDGVSGGDGADLHRAPDPVFAGARFVDRRARTWRRRCGRSTRRRRRRRPGRRWTSSMRVRGVGSSRRSFGVGGGTGSRSSRSSRSRRRSGG